MRLGLTRFIFRDASYGLRDAAITSMWPQGASPRQCWPPLPLQYGMILAFNLDSVLFMGISEKVKQMKTLVNTLLFIIGLTVLSAPAAFAAGTLKFEPKVNTTMREALIELTKERVVLSLGSGEKIEGKVAMVGNSVVYITQLSGKIEYNAVVSIEKIVAVIFRKEFD